MQKNPRNFEDSELDPLLCKNWIINEKSGSRILEKKIQDFTVV